MDIPSLQPVATGQMMPDPPGNPQDENDIQRHRNGDIDELDDSVTDGSAVGPELGKGDYTPRVEDEYRNEIADIQLEFLLRDVVSNPDPAGEGMSKGNGAEQEQDRHHENDAETIVVHLATLVRKFVKVAEEGRFHPESQHGLKDGGVTEHGAEDAVSLRKIRPGIKGSKQRA